MEKEEAILKLDHKLSGADLSAIILWIPTLTMKYEVIYVAGNTRLSEEVYANSPREAQMVVLARNPNGRIVNVCAARNR